MKPNTEYDAILDEAVKQQNKPWTPADIERLAVDLTEAGEVETKYRNCPNWDRPDLVFDYVEPRHCGSSLSNAGQFQVGRQRRTSAKPSVSTYDKKGDFRLYGRAA